MNANQNASEGRPPDGSAGSPSIGRVDRYRLERDVGSGSTSRVFLATDTVTGQRVVLKALPRELRKRRADIDGLRSALGRAARLQHPGLNRLLHLAQLWEPDEGARAAGLGNGHFTLVLNAVDPHPLTVRTPLTTGRALDALRAPAAALSLLCPSDSP